MCVCVCVCVCLCVCARARRCLEVKISPDKTWRCLNTSFCIFINHMYGRKKKHNAITRKKKKTQKTYRKLSLPLVGERVHAVTLGALNDVTRVAVTHQQTQTRRRTPRDTGRLTGESTASDTSCIAARDHRKCLALQAMDPWSVRPVKQLETASMVSE